MNKSQFRPGDRRHFHVTIKGLCFDRTGRLLLVKEKDGVWDLPGGRLEHGEGLHEALTRECQEEMSLNCQVLDNRPYWLWSALDRDGLWKVVLGYRVKFAHLKFVPSEECVALRFLNASGMRRIPLVPQTRPLIDFLLSREAKKGSQRDRRSPT